MHYSKRARIRMSEVRHTLFQSKSVIAFQRFNYISDMNGNTALHHASRNVHVRLVQLLCNRGADVSARDLYFRSFISYIQSFLKFYRS